MEIYAIIKRGAVNDPTGLSIKDKNGNEIGTIVEYDKETGEIIIDLIGLDDTLTETIGQFEDIPQALVPDWRMADAQFLSTPSVVEDVHDMSNREEWGVGIAESMVDEEKVQIINLSDDTKHISIQDDTKQEKSTPQKSEIKKKFKNKRKHRNRHKKFKNNKTVNSQSNTVPSSQESVPVQQPVENVQKSGEQQ